MLETFAGLFVLLVWLGFLIAIAAAVVATPIYLVVEVIRLVRGRRRALAHRREQARFELREQYAAGMLTLVGLEERLESTLRASSHFEVDSVLADLKPRRKPPLPVAAFETVSGVAILLLFHGLLARGAGAVLVLGGLGPPRRWRPIAAAFLAGLALLVSPLAAVAFAISAAWRFARPGA